MTKLLAGIDIGTTGLKVSFYTDHGELVDRTYREYALSMPFKGWVEFDPKLWWSHVCNGLQEVFSRGKVKAEEVKGIGITCTNSLIIMDAEQNILRPAIMQLDHRATAQVEQLTVEFGHEWIFEKTGNRIASGAFWGPTLLWLKQHEPHIFERIRYFLAPTSFLTFCLTGEYSIDHSRASSTMLYNIFDRRWDSELCQAFSLHPEELPPIYSSSEVIGFVHSEAAARTGLKPGTPVIAGAMDTIGAWVGLGVEASSGALIMGTVCRICVENDKLDLRFMNTVCDEASPPISMTPINSAGISMKWIKKLLFSDCPATGLYDEMDRMAESIHRGAEGLMYVPYLTGERSPIWDPHASGSFFGLELRHDKAHLIRAVLEGVGFALAQNDGILKEECGINPTYLYAGGGGARSRLWMQIISDILGKRLLIPAELETETKGAAMLAGWGIGLFPDLASLRKKWIKVERQVIPNPDAHSFYSHALPIFRAYYENNKELIWRWKQLQMSEPKGFNL
ncbi:xylulokinase [Ammoniphilus resinae]|uniref:Xylulokinase n=1 Tax=Ammoniphilus resinae TaxID=861532 RepID=A0ABS4GWC5_9BACL|nr:FGGY family carbohydrate kinase [Ammoniphilus resinae]MBP1934579.1 xylulokinase [Ammoniphilus resinae]